MADMKKREPRSFHFKLADYECVIFTSNPVTWDANLILSILVPADNFEGIPTADLQVTWISPQGKSIRLELANSRQLAMTGGGGQRSQTLNAYYKIPPEVNVSAGEIKVDWVRQHGEARVSLTKHND